MDFLDSLDLQTNEKRSNRMRSWYLYEQYKSLERHQLDAAEQLTRSNQERLLLRELSERRARRRLYDQAGLSRSEPRPDPARTPLSTTSDDFYESFCELNDDFTLDPESLDTQDYDTDKAFMEDFKGLGDDTSYAESVTSVIANSNDYDNYSKKWLTQSQNNIAENINMQLATVKENMLCLEKYARLPDVDRSLPDLSVKSSDLSNKSVGGKIKSLYDSNAFTMWSRLVSFAYQLIQLNHVWSDVCAGNCYHDYSLQLMAAVLAADVLRRGINRMCDILQPYVSPVKYTDSIDGDAAGYKNVKRKKYCSTKNTRKSSRFKVNRSVYNVIATRLSGDYHSDGLWRHCSKHSGGGRRRASAGSSSGLFPRPRVSRACRHRKVVNPMLEVVRHLDNILMADVDEFVHVLR